MLLCLTAAPWALAESEDVWNFDTFAYSLDGYTGNEADLIIPDVIGDCTVDILGLNAFNNTPGISSITLPSTLLQIEDGAISFCDDLTSITLNEGLLIIGDNCFSGNAELTEIVIPASVCYIGNNSFNNCSSLMQVTFEGECPVFAGVAFDWLPDGAVIRVPEDQLDAYSSAFSAMDLSPVLQGSGANAPDYDFSCDPEKFVFDEETGTILFFNGYDVRVDIPAEIAGVPVRAIDADAFANQQYLCYLTLPEGLETIGENAFESCYRLVHVEFPSTLKSIGSRAFANGLHGWTLNLPEGLLDIGSEAFERATKLSGALMLPQGLKTIGERAFSTCLWLEEVYIPDTVESIGENAFEDCGLTYVSFEGLQLPEMPDSVFSACDDLADIDLHHKASRQQMLDLQAVVDQLGLSCRVWRMQNPDVDYINDGLDTYEGSVMTGYTGTQTHLRPWDLNEDITVTALGDGAFKGNSVIEYFSVPYNDAFTTIGAEAFADSTLRQIDLFDSVTTIGEGALRSCVNLQELTLPESVTFVGEGALDGCTGLKKLIVLCDPAVLPDTLLADCPEDMEIYASATASDEQLSRLSMLADRPFWKPVTRLGEALPQLQEMPYEPLAGEDFWYDADSSRIDQYEGYELNLVLPRQIDGTELTMIGGSLMTRASWGDNYEAELPVVSLVIPETYSEIPAYAFMNCETLETFVCYAPVETLPDSLFQNCTSLREVIFVNGVHDMGMYVFDNCPNLETVYIGPYARNISEYAFLSGDGSAAFQQSACITDPALMPDVDALLEAVKREPMALPEPTAAPVAVPVGEEGAAFFGVWKGTELSIGGDSYSFADFDMAMTILLCEDGRMFMSESDDIDPSLAVEGDWLVWHVENGAAYADQSVMTLLSDGRLCVEDEEVLMIFEKTDQSVPSIPAAAPSPAETSAPLSVSHPVSQPSGSILCETRYVCLNADVDSYTIDASMLGGEYSLILHENGSADFVVVGANVPDLPWTQGQEGSILLDYYGTVMELVPTDLGFDMNFFDTLLLHFAPAE